MSYQNVIKRRVLKKLGSADNYQSRYIWIAVDTIGVVKLYWSKSKSNLDKYKSLDIRSCFESVTISYPSNPKLDKWVEIILLFRENIDPNSLTTAKGQYKNLLPSDRSINLRVLGDDRVEYAEEFLSCICDILK